MKKYAIQSLSKGKACIFACLLSTLLMTVAEKAVAQEIHEPRYYVTRAESYVQSQAWTEAKREIDDGLTLYPDNADLRYLNGRYYYTARRYEDSRYNLVRCIQNDDQHYRAKRLLVDVEDETKHYSSAICYINELLEFQPYDRDLWRRKISLYRKMGDDVEADATLTRLARIYPNDTIVQQAMKQRNHAIFNNMVQKNRYNDAAEQLEQWLENDPSNQEYYMELIGLYLQLGEKEKALVTIDRALIHFPNSQELVDKKVGMLTEMGRFVEALSFSKRYGTGTKAYRFVMQAAADASRLNDPYEQHARVYAQMHSRDALTYLLNTSLTRGYYDDALYYLNEAMRRDGRTPDLLMKQYTLERRMGNDQAAWRLLNELHQLRPDDEEITDDYVQHLLQCGDQDIMAMQWTDACQNFRQALDIMPVGNERWPATMSKYIMSLGRMGHYLMARQQYLRALALDSDNQARYASAYEEVVGSHIHTLTEEEDYLNALQEAELLLRVLPTSEVALRSCINMSETLYQKTGDKRYEQAAIDYARRGYEAHPDVPYFVVKQAVALSRAGSYDDALRLTYPNSQNGEEINPIISAARNGISNDYALLLLKDRKAEQALMVVNIALRYDANNRELLYTRGLIQEQLKDYAEAYALQKKYYEPSNAEQRDYYEHMRWLHNRSFKNRVDATYAHASYDNRQGDFSTTAHLYSLASVAYSRAERHDTYTGEVSYKGIDGYQTDEEQVAGGAGIQLMAQWEHSFGKRWSSMASLAWSNRFFNKWSANLAASYEMNRGWTPSLRLGYRRTPTSYLFLSNAAEREKYHLFIVTPSIEKAWERIRTSLSVDVSMLKTSVYYNIGLKGKLFINDDNVSSVGLSCGIGSFPELSFFEQTALRYVSHTNTMVGLDFLYLLTDHLSAGLSGNWNTCYNPLRNTDGTLTASYRNIYSLSLHLHMAF